MSTVPDIEQWERGVSPAIRGDALWKLKAYRVALYLGDLGWDDVSRLYRDPRTRSLADQLYRALGSVGANIAEGYSRGSGRDRVRFYEYALGSAREARHWYHQARLSVRKRRSYGSTASPTSHAFSSP